MITFKKALSLSIIALCSVLLTSCAVGRDRTGNQCNPQTRYSLQLRNGEVISDLPYVICIEKDPDQDFTILNFADVQMDKDDPNFPFLRDSINALTAQAEPDLITLTGDQTYGYSLELHRICQLIDRQNIPWAPVFGNHDCNQKELTLSQQAESYHQYPNCLFLEGPSGLAKANGNTDAIGHYVINIVEIEGDSFRVVRSLILMNSCDKQEYKAKDHSKPSYNGYSWASLTDRQVQWYQDMVQSVQPYGANGQVSCGMILHIPPFGYVKAAQEAFNINEDIYNVDSWMDKASAISYRDSFNPDFWQEGYKDSFGIMHEKMGCPPYDDGVLERILETGMTDFILAGHEHVNNFSINYQGIRLVYAMKTGKGCYYEDGSMGGTVITVKSDGSCSIEHILYPN